MRTRYQLWKLLRGRNCNLFLAISMLLEATELIGRQVYTNDARLLGEVSNLVVDMESARIDGIFISETNSLLVDDSASVNVPFRWVAAVNDVIILRHFPKKIRIREPPPSSPGPAPPSQATSPAGSSVKGEKLPKPPWIEPR